MLRTVRRLSAVPKALAWSSLRVANRLRDHVTSTLDGIAPLPYPNAQQLRSAPEFGPPLRLDLTGKVAVVTGASGELGRVMARTLASAGAAVAIHYFKSRERAEQLCSELESSGARAVLVRADVGDANSVTRMRDDVVARLGVADIVVANAVEQYAWRSILDQPTEDFESQFKTCVMQTVLTAKAFAPGMIAKGSGRIIAISTECAMLAAAGTGAYVAGKRGMDGVMRVLARELGPHNITVNQVAPGWTISDRHRQAGQERQPHYERRIPLRRRGSDQEIANAVAFLASDLASYITGAFIPVCGGHVMPTI